jgi:L-threonylcarbamoyladenylate synthase
MDTKTIKIDRYIPEKNKIDNAASIIKNGGLVAFPTETIYGLGANALDEKAVEKIFIAKGRPQDNPLIVHISKKQDLVKYVKEIPDKAKKLINKFWPGPLTIIFKKKLVIPDRVTCGLKTIAVRMPLNKIALELIKKSGVPIAAPSANSSGKPSPTKAKHVFDDLNGKIDLIIDGGQTDIGLESTVISLVNPEKPILLRPGKISAEEIERFIGGIIIHKGVYNKIMASKKVESPGLKYQHYSPKAKVILVIGKSSELKINQLKKQYEIEGKKADIIIESSKNKFAKEIFSKFRDCEKDGVDIILVKGVDEKGIGMAIMNRLRRAASEIIES